MNGENILKNVVGKPSTNLTVEAELTATAPQTIAQELQDRMQVLIERAVSYRDEADFELASLARDARKLLAADAASAHVVLGMLECLKGRKDTSDRHFDSARSLHAPISLLANWWCAKLNLGYMSEAEALTSVMLDPRSDIKSFLTTGPIAFTCGSIKATCELIDRANAMNTDLKSFPVETYRRAQKLMDEFGLSDSDLADVLDVAGEVLREHKLFYAGPAAKLEVIDAPFYPDRGLYFLFDVGTSAADAAGMYAELAGKMCDKFDPLPEGVHVSFRGIGANQS